MHESSQGQYHFHSFLGSILSLIPAYTLSLHIFWPNLSPVMHACFSNGDGIPLESSLGFFGYIQAVELVVRLKP